MAWSIYSGSRGRTAWLVRPEWHGGARSICGQWYHNCRGWTFRGLQAIGVEVNPAAVELARVFSLMEIPLPKRKEILAEAGRRLTECLFGGDQTLFGESESDLLDEVLFAYKGCDTPEAANLVAVLMLAMGDTSKLDRQRLRRAVSQFSRVVDGLPGSVTRSRIQPGDARNLPLPGDSVDLVITSPPYINVFNYHQNYRAAIESLGWQVLPSARSEIGSNRKHRQNRFLTVIQYSLDMFLALQDIARVCKSGSKIVIVVGRESRVRGVSFANGDIISCLAEFVPQLNYVRWQERQFTNPFGETIYEEILTFEAIDKPSIIPNLEIPGALGCHVLKEGLERAASAEIRSEIEGAVSSTPKCCRCLILLLRVVTPCAPPTSADLSPGSRAAPANATGGAAWTSSSTRSGGSARA